MRKLLMIGLILVLGSCKSKKLTADSSQRFVIENLGQVSSADELRKLFPDAQMKEDVGMFEEGTVEMAYTILFPDSENEALITWSDKNRTQIHNIRIDNGGDWKSKTGIRIGTSYEELVKMNGPLKFYGFGWDYSGAVDWNNGKFDNSLIRVFLAPENTPPSKFYGDSVIEASPAEIEALNLTVQAMLFQKPER